MLIRDAPAFRLSDAETHLLRHHISPADSCNFLKTVLKIGLFTLLAEVTYNTTYKKCPKKVNSYLGKSKEILQQKNGCIVTAIQSERGVSRKI